MYYNDLYPYGDYGPHTVSAQIGADRSLAVLDKDGYERTVSLEQLRQEGALNARPLFNQTIDYGNRSARVSAAVYWRKYDVGGVIEPFSSLPEALRYLASLTSPFYQRDRPVIYAACFDLTRNDWWIPVVVFPKR